ncbi:MAG: glycosyltransferase family 39 protein [Chloroflexota bacterium]|nr:glycosyltransferase family 39 protein [Chloroflexota bacterium]
MTTRQRLVDALALTCFALIARVAAAMLVDWPPYTDPSYYTLVATRLADGFGFTVPAMWSFLEVGGSIPADPMLPVASNGHWMPLTSIVAAGSMLLLGSDYRGGQPPMVLLSTGLVPATYLIGIRFWHDRRVAVIGAILAVFAGPLLIMYPTIDNFAIFGSAGCGAIWLGCEAVNARRPLVWLVGSGVAVGLATLARVDGLLLALAPMTAWVIIVRRSGRSQWPQLLGIGLASLAAFSVVVAPWAVRNIAEFGAPLPSAGGHTLWITTYNEQFTVSREPSIDSYLSWGPLPILSSKLVTWGELAGRTAVLLGGIFAIPFMVGMWRERRNADIGPFLTYFLGMFITMGLVFTFHAPKGAFYHSAPAWLPFAFPLAVANMPPAALAASRFWRFLARPATHRFLGVAGLAGAIVLSLIGSSILYQQWRISREREMAAASFLSMNGRADDVIMYSDPASMAITSGNPGVAAPFDGYPVQEQIMRAYDVKWVVVTLGPGATTDPLGFWEGGRARDANGSRAFFLADEPSFEADGVRIFRVLDS